MLRCSNTCALYLGLFELYQLQDVLFEPVVLGPGVSEHVDERPWEGDLQSLLDGTDAHFRAVPTSLRRETSIRNYRPCSQTH